MRYMLDTCALIHLTQDYELLSPDVQIIIEILPISKEQIITYGKLSINEAENHKDPSDHVIIAHAITNKMPLISCDRKFQFYTKQGLDLISYRRGG
ncbi:MAG: PIN domain-containing protein [Paludibacteraceae bacterium]|nr:PIN domain-containing protein [Paludibacteraceae bacterium]